MPPQSAAVVAPVSLNQRWMFGIERMHNDPLILQPNTNRFIAALAAMPQVLVVYLDPRQNEHLFSAWSGARLRVYSTLRAENNCMEITYVVSQAGQQEATFGLVVPPLSAGPESEAACVDRAATSFYQALATQGL